MVTEVWRFQYHYYSRFDAVAVLPDGSVVVAGNEANSESGTRDFVAFKLDPSDGSILWKWKDGSDQDDYIMAAAAAADGSVVLAGFTLGSWLRPNNDSRDLAVVRLDSNKKVSWSIQDGSAYLDAVYDMSVAADGGFVVLAGFTYGK